MAEDVRSVVAEGSFSRADEVEDPLPGGSTSSERYYPPVPWKTEGCQRRSRLSASRERAGPTLGSVPVLRSGAVLPSGRPTARVTPVCSRRLGSRRSRRRSRRRPRCRHRCRRSRRHHRNPVERVVAGVALEVVVAVIPLQVVGTAATACWTPRSSPSNYERPLGNLISAGEWWGMKSPWVTSRPSTRRARPHSRRPDFWGGGTGTRVACHRVSSGYLSDAPRRHPWRVKLERRLIARCTFAASNLVR
jgi:hypothetical protein